MNNKKVLITGICGQDGAYLANYLLKKGFKVYGIYRRSSSDNLWRLRYFNIINKVSLFDIDLKESIEVFNLIRKLKPNQIYNLAAQSFVQTSFTNPHETTQTNAIAVLNLLESIRSLKLDCGFYQASTSEMFGNINSVKQGELSGFYPRSPYAVAKLYAHYLCKNYKEAYNMSIYSGILFNHESPLRGMEFVTRKITFFLAQYYSKQNSILELGNIYSKRDWGFAGEYVEVMHKILISNKAFDYVVGTGKTTSIKQFINYCLKHLNIRYQWEGTGINEVCIDKKNNKIFIRINKKFYRPTEVNFLKADITKIKKDLKWQPKVSVDKLAIMMLDEDLKRIN